MLAMDRRLGFGGLPGAWIKGAPANGIVDRHISDTDAQRNLDLVLARKWRNASGFEFGTASTCVGSALRSSSSLDQLKSESP